MKIHTILTTRFFGVLTNQDLARRSGAVVFSASRGDELSYERSDLKNGLFTEAILEALQTPTADIDADGTVSLAELRRYVTRRVAALSKGRQHPTVDRDNRQIEFGFKVRR